MIDVAEIDLEEETCARKLYPNERTLEVSKSTVAKGFSFRAEYYF
jgi:hypothetical protein